MELIYKNQFLYPLTIHKCWFTTSNQSHPKHIHTTTDVQVSAIKPKYYAGLSSVGY